MPRSKGSFRKKRGDRRYKERPVSDVSGQDQTRERVSDCVHDEREISNQIEDCAKLSIDDIKALVRACGRPEHISHQPRLLELAMQGFLDGRAPRAQQIRALRRLVYGIGDTLLVAKTGFGKSIIFHAFSVLTDYITLQIIPISKLGQEQLDAIRRYPGAKPCLLTADTKKANPRLLSEIRRGEFTHILLGPEQLMSPEFRRLFLDTMFYSRVRLVAIDECHVIRQWKDFRREFLRFQELRRSLSSQAVFFACTATLDAVTEADVCRYGGFHRVGTEPGFLEIIRTSIDRPEIGISIQPIEKGQQGSHAQLLALLHDCVDSESHALTPSRIPRTIIFVDGRTRISAIATLFQRWLVQKGYSPRMARDTVGVFTARVAKSDQERLYRTFASNDSPLRIMIATTALGMGIDLSGVECVVQWNFLITEDLGDLVQRFGRAARREGQTGIAIFFVPYWAFDCLGEDPPNTNLVSGGAQGSSSSPRRRRRTRNTLHRDRGQSSLRQVITASDVSDVNGDSDSAQSVTGTSSGRQQRRRKRSDGVTCVERVRLARKRDHNTIPSPCQWTTSDIKQRSKLDPLWKKFINSACHRDFILDHFQESLTDPTTRKDRPPPQTCCTGCNSELGALPKVSIPKPPPKAPKPNSKAWFALNHISRWCDERAREVAQVPNDQQFIPVPSEFFLPASFQWQLSRIVGAAKNAVDFKIRTTDDLNEVVPPTQWRYSREYAPSLLTFLRQNVDSIVNEYKNVMGAGAGSETEQDTVSSRAPSPSHRLISRDNQLAYLAAIQRQRMQENHQRLFGDRAATALNNVVGAEASLDAEQDTASSRAPSPTPRITSWDNQRQRMQENHRRLFGDKAAPALDIVVDAGAGSDAEQDTASSRAPSPTPSIMSWDNQLTHLAATQRRRIQENHRRLFGDTAAPALDPSVNATSPTGGIGGQSPTRSADGLVPDAQCSQQHSPGATSILAAFSRPCSPSGDSPRQTHSVVLSPGCEDLVHTDMAAADAAVSWPTVEVALPPPSSPPPAHVVQPGCDMSESVTEEVPVDTSFASTTPDSVFEGRLCTRENGTSRIVADHSPSLRPRSRVIEGIVSRALEDCRITESAASSAKGGHL